jgi:molybdopterin molybdotransferase
LADLLNVDHAIQRILEHIQPLPIEAVPIRHAYGRVLAHDIQAQINLPPFPNSSMDGYAVRAEDIAGASQQTGITLQVIMDIPAGKSPSGAISAGQAARIMTGAPLPPGADAVVPVEQTDSIWSAGDEIALPPTVTIYTAARSGAHVRPEGEDIQVGQVVLRAGIILRPQDIGVLVALGYDHAPVVRQPRVAIISTGDELVEAGQPLTPGKIRDVNSYTIAGLVSSYGGVALPLPIAPDTLDAVRDVFRQALDQRPDLIISSAGVSVGTFDVVRAVLDELGQVSFWRVNLRPGKPLAFGLLGQVPFFGLPGNPVSAMVTFDVFVRPALLKLLRQPENVMTDVAITGEDIHSDGRRSYLRVKLIREDGHLVAHTTGTQSSGALMSMVLADGLLIIPETVTFVAKGTQLPVRLLRSSF